jgi:quinol monooxygenase YgiN
MERQEGGGLQPRGIGGSIRPGNQQETDMIHVLAFITTKPGQREAVLEAFNANIPAVRAEEGCIEYGAAIDVAGADPAFGPDSFVVVEKWASRAALKAHAASPHMAAYAAKVKPLIEKRAVHILDPV